MIRKYSILDPMTDLHPRSINKMSSTTNFASSELVRPKYSSQNQIQLSYISSQNLANHLKQSEIHRDSKGRAYYVDHELESRSYKHPSLLAEMRMKDVKGHAALMVDTTSEGREYLVDYNLPGVIGPLEHGHAGMYCGSRVD